MPERINLPEAFSDAFELSKLAEKTIIKVMMKNKDRYNKSEWRNLPIEEHAQHAFEHAIAFLEAGDLQRYIFTEEEMTQLEMREDLENALTRLAMALYKLDEQEIQGGKE